MRHSATTGGAVKAYIKLVGSEDNTYVELDGLTRADYRLLERLAAASEDAHGPYGPVMEVSLTPTP